MALLKHLFHLWKSVKKAIKWVFLSLFTGALGGILGAGFHFALRFVTQCRAEHRWLILLLPVAGLISVLLYKTLRIEKTKGTNEMIEAALDGRRVPFAMAPGIFLSTCLTHLFGGSAGREGAALQLGGAVASLLGRLFRLSEAEGKIIVRSGMASVFAGLFGTPAAAALFCLEFEAVGTILPSALLPCFLSAFTAGQVSSLLGVSAEFSATLPAAKMGLATVGKVALLALVLALLGMAMCAVLRKAEQGMKRILPSAYVRIAVGGAAVVIMTVIVGSQRYGGSGAELIPIALDGKVSWYDFPLKLLFTAVTLAAGFRGGEIVPTFCIGACFGCTVGGLLGLDAGLCAALGLAGLFCAVTKAPLASIVLSAELFGTVALPLFVLTCAICFACSGRRSLYASQRFPTKKAYCEENNVP